MSTVAEDILERFDQLPEAEKQQLTKEILRRTKAFDLAPLSDEELTVNAESLFLELDRREAEDGRS